jgi:hypothetical protein
MAGSTIPVRDLHLRAFTRGHKHGVALIHSVHLLAKLHWQQILVKSGSSLETGITYP